MCKCGCRGHCTLHPLFTFLEWSFHAMLTGIRPHLRHDGTHWDEGSHLAGSAGTELNYRAVLINIKCDMMEYVTSLGLPSWSSIYCPCCMCSLNQDALHGYEGSEYGATPWGSPQNYELSCRSCEHIVDIISDDMRRIILRGGGLHYDIKIQLGGATVPTIS
eukprot:8698189-Pyramimonas_sp.AAC.1